MDEENQKKNPRHAALQAQTRLRQDYAAERINRVIQFLRTADLSMDDLSQRFVCNKFGYTQEGFSRAFKKQSGQLYADFVEDLRMKKLHSLLSKRRGTPPHISMLVAQTGFKNSKVLERTFRKHRGISLGDYLKKRQFDSDSARLDYRDFIGRPHANPKVQRAVFHIVDSDLQKDDVSLEVVAREVGCTDKTLSASFKKSLDINYFDFVSLVVVDKMKAIIAEKPDLDGNELAARVGYKNSKSVAGMFKKHAGCTPHVFKQQVAEKAEECIQVLEAKSFPDGVNQAYLDNHVQDFLENEEHDAFSDLAEMVQDVKGALQARWPLYQQLSQ